MTTPRSQIPQQTQVIDQATGLISNPWYYYLNSLQNQVGPPGSTGVIDATANITAPTYLYQDVIADRPLAFKQALYFSLDTGEIFTVNNGGAWQLQIPQFTGDVTNLPNSKNLVLGDVNFNPGLTNGIATDLKGRVLQSTPITVTGAASGTVVGSTLNLTLAPSSSMTPRQVCKYTSMRM